MDIKKEIIDKISEILGKDADIIDKMMTKNETIERGNYSLPCFKFASEMKTNPQVIANDIKEKLQLDFIEKCEVVGGFLNIFVKKEMYIQTIIEEIEKDKEKYASTHKGAGKKALVEHTSINPNASPHIGRARNAILGDSIVKLLKYNDYDVEVHYFVNDIGKQIAMLVLASREKTAFDFEDLLQMYIEVNRKVKESPELEQQVFDILDKLESGDKDIINEFRSLVKICIDGQTAIFNELGINYDYFDYESEFIINGDVDNVLKALEKTGKLFEAEDRKVSN